MAAQRILKEREDTETPLAESPVSNIIETIIEYSNSVLPKDQNKIAPTGSKSAEDPIGERGREALREKLGRTGGPRPGAAYSVPPESSIRSSTT